MLNVSRISVQRAKAILADSLPEVVEMVKAGDVTASERLRELRAVAGLTQGQLAEKAKLHRVEVAKLEIGNRSPSWETVLAICTALGVSCEEFRQEARHPRPRRLAGPARPTPTRPGRRSANRPRMRQGASQNL